MPSETTPHFDPRALETLKERGFVQQATNLEALGAALKAGPVTFYAGFDPTASSLHVGSLVPLMAMAHLARAGHRPIAVLGGGTTMVGDPSGKSEMRAMMTRDTIEGNRRAIDPQVRRFVETPGGSPLVVDNAEWLVPLGYLEFLRDIGRHFSVNRMLAAEAYKQRLEKGLSFIEFNYQLLQAYDFLVLFRRHQCTLQIGGDDQWGNILAGSDLVRRLERSEVHGLTFPLITTAAGAKMGKTAAGAIWLDPERTSHFDFYQYFVNVDDRDVERFLKLFTFLPLSEIQRLSALEGAGIREAKAALAYNVTEVVRGKAAADEARAGADAAFGGGRGASGNAQAVPSYTVPSQGLAEGLKLVDVLASSGLAASKSAARRLIAQGGVRLGETKLTSIDHVLKLEDVPSDGIHLHAGRKHLRRLVKD